MAERMAFGDTGFYTKEDAYDDMNAQLAVLAKRHKGHVIGSVVFEAYENCWEWAAEIAATEAPTINEVVSKKLKNKPIPRNKAVR